MPKQAKGLFAPIGQDGVERSIAYAEEFLFFKQGSDNQTNGTSPEVNRVWCSGAAIHGEDIQKQYGDDNYDEVWFKEVELYVSEEAISNKDYFTKND